ncbi:MAG TPA: cupredoxin family protein [Burkholderiales bacterium]
MQKQLFVIALAASVAIPAFAQDEPQKPKPPAGHDHSSTGHTHSGSKAFGRPGDPTKVARTIVVEMRDPVEFFPADITVMTGETVRFVVVNTGKHEHEMVLGTMKELEAHGEMMKQQKDMHHDEPHMAQVAPGKSGVIVWQFTRPGEFYYACLVEDHFELGMYGKIRVR